MSRYDYKCPDHGIFEAIHPMNEARWKFPCLICGKVSDRVIYSPGVSGDLPTTKVKIGYNRNELFKNLATEGFADKRWQEADESSLEKAITYAVIEMLGDSEIIGYLTR